MPSNLAVLCMISMILPPSASFSILRTGPPTHSQHVRRVCTGATIPWTDNSFVLRKLPPPQRSASIMKAGPPKIDLQDGEVVYTEVLCPGSRLIRVKSVSLPLEYEPGHVLALQVPRDGTEDAEGEGQNKGKHGDGTKGPYTVTRADTGKNTFDVVYRVVKEGRLSQRLAKLRRGALISFGGRFHESIQSGINSECSGICLISTGVGIGPVLGYLEQAQAAGEARPTRVYAGFRALEDVLFEEELEQLESESGGRVQCQVCVSELSDERYPPPPGFEGLRGRVSASVPQVLDKEDLPVTHFHLIGNGGMVNNFQAALVLAGVPDSHITTEVYFNHKTTVDAGEVKEIVAQLNAPAQHQVWAGAES